MAKTCGFCPCLRWRKPRAALPGMAPGGRRQGAKRPKRAGPGARSFCLAGPGAFGPRAAKRRRPPGAIPGRAARARRRGGPFPKVAGQRPWNMGERLSFRLGPFLKNGFGWPADSPRMGRGRLSALGDAGASEGGRRRLAAQGQGPPGQPNGNPRAGAKRPPPGDSACRKTSGEWKIAALLGFNRIWRHVRQIRKKPCVARVSLHSSLAAP